MRRKDHEAASGSGISDRLSGGIVPAKRLILGYQGSRATTVLDQNKLTIPFPILILDFGADAIGGKRFDEMRLRSAAPRSAAG